MNIQTVPVDTVEARRLEQAADWFLRLREVPAEEAVFIQWMEWCGEDSLNLDAYEEIKQTWSLTTAAPARAGTAAKARRWVVPAALAASLLLAVVAGMLFYLRPAGLRLTEQSLSTPIAMHSDGLLPDGSKVVLGAASRLSSHFSGARRLVKVERGEAFFDVAKDPQRPFVVEAGDLRVTALGTSFNVRRGVERIVVTVEKGVVEVASSSAPPWRAEAGQQVSYSIADGKLATADVDPMLATAWQQGVLKYVREPLADVVADLNRYSTRHITISDPALAQQRYTGTVFGNHVDDWLGALETAFPVRVIQEEGWVAIVPR